MTIQGRYKISLRITHPYIDSERISSELGLAPKFQYNVGDQKLTPKGNVVPGTRKESFWLYEFFSVNEPFEHAVDRLTSALDGKKIFLKEITGTGGRLEYFIGWFTSQNSGLSLKPDLLRRLAEIEITLSLDIYPE